MKQKIFTLTIKFTDGAEEKIEICDTVGEGIELMENAIKVYSDYDDKWAHMRIIPYSSIKEFEVKKEIKIVK